MAELIKACRRGDLALVKKHIKEGHNVDGKYYRQSRSLQTPLTAASSAGHSDIVRYLLENSAYVNETDHFGRSALHLASDNGHLDIVNMLIFKGADIDAEDECSRTPLISAAVGGHHSVVEVLISSGALFDKKNKKGRTALHHAAEAISVKCSCLLIEAGADMSIISKKAQAALVHQAVKEGLDSQLKTLVIAGAPVNHEDEYCHTALHYACENGSFEIVSVLISKGANIDAEDQNGSTPLMWAAERGHNSVVAVLIFSGASFNKKNKEGRTALQHAAEAINVKCSCLLMEAGADISIISKKSQAALVHQAVREGLDSQLKTLVIAGAPVNNKDEHCLAALHYACKDGGLDIVNVLISKGANIETEDQDGSTPLMWAAERGHHSVVEVLISSGASVNKKNRKGCTALHYACENGGLDTVNVLISKGANIDAEDQDGSTPLMWAAERGHSSVVEVLISSGASVNKKNRKGCTALHYACENGGLDTVNVLISKGANIDVEDQNGSTPLMWAAERGHNSVMEALISSGASVNKKNRKGHVALHHAAEAINVMCSCLLMEAGADISIISKKSQAALVHQAVMEGLDSQLKTLVIAGAPVNNKDEYCTAALHYACRNGGLDIVNVLISKGANIDAEDQNGSTPLMWAAERGHNSVVEVLISSGASVNKKNRKGHVALHHAAEAINVMCSCLLIEAGADISIISMESQAALVHQAVKEGLDSQLKTLVIAGAPVNHEDEYGLTALHHATVAEHVRCSCLLIEAGADMSSISKESQAALVHQALKEGLDSQLKVLILAGAPVNHKDEYGQTALHYAAEHNHIQCGILLAEGGADIQIKGSNGERPIDYASAEFKAAVEQALSFRSKKTICVIGYACSGKSTLIASLQNENAPFFKKVSNRIFGVKDIHQRTAGIAPVSLSSKRYGNVAMFDFAGQEEYHGPHELFLKSILTKTGSTVTIILVVKVTEEESVISQQLYRWLTPLSKISSSSSPVRVIVVGSFLDKVKSKAQAEEKLSHCYQMIQEDLKDTAVEFLGTCSLNCRQPYSSGIDQLCQLLDEVPAPKYKAAETLYSISWVISQLNHAFNKEAIKLIDLTKWMNDNKANLPTNLPLAEAVCSDLSATGHFLYLPNKVDSSKSWLILDLAAILHDVYGRIFSPFKKIVDQFGLLKCHDLQDLFPTLEKDMIHNVLIALEFCIEVDPTLLSEEIMKLKGSKEDDFLFFPALVSANPPQQFLDLHVGAEIHTLCWQLQADYKHFISPRLMQTTILRLAAHQVFHHQSGRNTKEHCCSVWWNGISWQSPDGVDVAVQIRNNALVQVLGRSKAGPDVLSQYISEITSDIIATILQLLPDFSANSYIIHSSNPISLFKEPKNISSHETFPIGSIFSIMKDCKEFCFSRPDHSGQPASLPVLDLFSGVKPSLDIIENLCFGHLVHNG